MATTVTAPVSNTMPGAKEYVPFLDEVYSTNSKTAILDTAAERVRFPGDGFAQADTVYLYSLNPVGMGDYDRDAGYVPGDTVGSWNSYALTIDRGRSYSVDALDNDFSKDLAVPNLLSVVEKTKIIPEVDATRFAAYYTGAAAANKVSATLSTGSAAVAAIDAATLALDEAEVPDEGRILFVSPKMYSLIKSGITRYIQNAERNIDLNVEVYNDMRVIMVPSARFNTSITLAQPSAHDGAGGYSLAGNAINFMVVHPSAVLQVMRHYNPRVFAPSQNTQAESWLVQPRYCHGAWVLSQKTKGIYVHAGTTVSG